MVTAEAVVVRAVGVAVSMAAVEAASAAVEAASTAVVTAAGLIAAGAAFEGVPRLRLDTVLHVRMLRGLVGRPIVPVVVTQAAAPARVTRHRAQALPTANGILLAAPTETAKDLVLNPHPGSPIMAAGT